MKKSILASGILGAASLVALLGCTPPALAARLVDVSVVNRSTGERLTPWRHGGKLYVAGTPGDRYAVELRSRRGERVLTVLSVDGVNVLTGQTAATLQSGYVLDGWQSYSINGWRKSMEDVAQFVFTALPDSYAARTGRPGNVGVIGVAVYREKPARRNPWRWRRKRRPGAMASAATRRRLRPPLRIPQRRRKASLAAVPAPKATGRLPRRPSPSVVPTRPGRWRKRDEVEEARHRPRRAGALADALHGVRAQQRHAG